MTQAMEWWQQDLEDEANYYRRVRGLPTSSGRGGWSRRPKPCGTYAAYMRHYRRKEKACDPCLQAKLEYDEDRRLRSPGPAA